MNCNTEIITLILHFLGVSEDTLNRNPDESLEIDVSEAIQPAATTSHATLRDGDIGSIIDDDDIPLLHCIRLLCSRFLLTGYPQGLIPDKQVRVSVKALALSCIGSAMNYAPHVFFMSLHKSSQQEGEWETHSDYSLVVLTIKSHRPLWPSDVIC